MEQSRRPTELCCVLLLLAACQAPALAAEPAASVEPASAAQPGVPRRSEEAGTTASRRRTTVRPADELREAYLDVVRQTSKSATRQDTFQPLELTADALRLYIEISQTEHFSHAARSRMRSRLKQRLLQLHDRLVRIRKRYERETAHAAPQPATRLRGPASTTASAVSEPQADSAAVLSGGAAEAAGASELIELIQETIAPDTWDIRGGRGTIRYFSLLRVLVVRQTGEAHHQLGSTLEVLRQQ